MLTLCALIKRGLKIEKAISQVHGSFAYAHNKWIWIRNNMKQAVSLEGQANLMKQWMEDYYGILLSSSLVW